MRAAGAEGRIMRRKSAGGREQPGSARVPRFGGSFRPGFVARRASQLTEHRPRSRVPGSNRAHLENVGLNRCSRSLLLPVTTAVRRSLGCGPRGSTMPNSTRWAREALVSIVRCRTGRLLVANRPAVGGL